MIGSRVFQPQAGFLIPVLHAHFVPRTWVPLPSDSNHVSNELGRVYGHDLLQSSGRAYVAANGSHVVSAPNVVSNRWEVA